MNSNVVSRACCIAVALVVFGCKASDAPKVPLGATQVPSGEASQPAVSGLAGGAKAALDSGNLLFRAKAYEQALAQYSRAAELAPSEVAPLLGIMMVADVTGNSALAKSTLPRIRKLDPSMADSSTVTAHSKMMKLHPPVGGPPST